VAISGFAADEVYALSPAKSAISAHPRINTSDNTMAAVKILMNISGSLLAVIKKN